MTTTRSGLSWRLLGIALGSLFLYAGALKAADPARFASDIDNYKVLPWSMVIRLAFYLPWLEIFCGAALISLRFYLGGLLLITGLLVIFIAISIAARARGLDISCGCFGHALDNMKFSWHLALDFILLAIATALSWRARLVRY